MPNRDLVVIGASAGGVEALQQLCAGLPGSLNAAVLVVMHASIQAGGLLAEILTRAGCLEAVHPVDGQLIEKGRVYVAPPDVHLIVEDHRLRLVHGKRENRHRPAVDPTFRSAALAYGERVIGVVLTGGLDDGSSGLMVVRAHGGAAVIQDPDSALDPSMPRNALKHVKDAHVATLQEIPALIVRLVSERIERRGIASSNDSWSVRHVRMAELDRAEVGNDIGSGKPSACGCPEGGGGLWEIDQAGWLRLRCRVGHGYTDQPLRAEQRLAVETALWEALRALEESASLYHRMAARAGDRASKVLDLQAKRYEERASTAESNARTLRDFLVRLNTEELEVPAESQAMQPATHSLSWPDPPAD